MGSISGAALGALIVGLVEQFALAYVPTQAAMCTFLLMAAVLVLRPQGLLGRAA
jgi:branched-chain amino acid transport system permease protein